MSKKFGEYADNEFANHWVSRTKNSSIDRIDVLFDVYRQKSIKASTRQDRGIGSLIRVVVANYAGESKLAKFPSSK